MPKGFAEVNYLRKKKSLRTSEKGGPEIQQLRPHELNCPQHSLQMGREAQYETKEHHRDDSTSKAAMCVLRESALKVNPTHIPPIV